MPERYLGKTLGKFRIDAIIGAGGFAWVYKAYDPELEIPVALKVLKPQYAGDEKFESRFRREASTAAKLRHPNIVKIFAVGRDGEAVYFAMDYLPQALQDRLDVMGTLPEPMLVRMAIDVASAIGFAHREGVIHRDIKTDNILFDEHGNAVVCDFGIARALSNYAQQTGTNMVVGTPQYFSPEQARGLPLDGRADIYSLGVTLFKAATGQLPFQGDDWYEIARQHVEDGPPKPRSINGALTREVERIILRCLEKEPEDRFDSGETMCRELAAVLEERGERASLRTLMVPVDNALSPAVSLPRLARRMRRLTREHKPLLVGSVLGLVVLLVILFRMGSGGGAADAAPAAGLRPAPVITQRVESPDERKAGGTPDAPAEPRVLAIAAPPEATVRVNGRSVGRGPSQMTDLAAGEYRVAASVPATAGCTSATDSQTVRLGQTGRTRVRLTPRGCGLLMIERAPAGATYAISSSGTGAGGPRLSGTLPLRQPLLLPAGRYTIVVRKRFCASYEDVHTVEAGAPPVRVRTPLICERS